MLRSLLLIPVLLAITLVFGPVVILVAWVRSDARIIDWIVRFWARSIVFVGGLDVRCENLEKLDPTQSYVIIANHYSYLDIPCLLVVFPQQIRFMAKVSLFKIPIFGWAIRLAGFIPIDRKNRRTAVRSLDLAAQRIRKGNTVVVFPEEGRSKYRWMKPFQRGAFILALKSQRPIVPVAIDGTHEILPVGKLGISPGSVTIRIGDPIPTEGLSIRAKDSLVEATREQISRMLFGDNPPLPPPELELPPADSGGGDDQAGNAGNAGVMNDGGEI